MWGSDTRPRVGDDRGMRVEQMADGVYRAEGTAVNWYLLTDGDQVTLIDAGYPGDVARVEESIARIGRSPEDIVAVLITHAHVDHIGAVNHLHQRYGTPMFTGEVEAAHARREFLEQAGVGNVVRHALNYGVLPWSLKITRVGATEHVTIPHAQALTSDGALDVPGRPVPIVTPGHTSGHTCFYLPESGAILTGDTIVTGHATSRRVGPQLLPAWFDHDHRGVEKSVETLSKLDADMLLPGHGGPWHGQLRNENVS